MSKIWLMLVGFLSIIIAFLKFKNKKRIRHCEEFATRQMTRQSYRSIRTPKETATLTSSLAVTTATRNNHVSLYSY